MPPHITTQERVAEMLDQLNSAGGDWAHAVRTWPEHAKIRPGRWQGQAWIRPAVFIAAEHPRFIGSPVVLLLHQDGTWFHKGTRQGRL